MKIKIFLMLLPLLAAAGTGCRKTTASGATSGTYTGVVVFSTCLHTMIQTIGPDYLGEDNWVSGTYSGATVYHHVFAVQNGCQFGDHNPGDTIRFRVISPQAQNCMYCMIAVAVPDSSYAIQVVN